MSLKTYNQKRRFTKTPEPVGKKEKSAGAALRFVVQMHRATRLHFDFRLEFDGVFRSWAVPRGPSMNPLDQRLAVFVEDHPLKYGSFEGNIPKGNYGAGTVMIWDEGTYTERGSESRRQSELAMLKGLERGHLTFVLTGHKLNGEFALIKLKKKSTADNAWLLVKKRDQYSSYKRDQKLDDRSATTGRTMDEIARKSKDVWLPKRSKDSEKVPGAKAAKISSGIMKKTIDVRALNEGGQVKDETARASRQAMPRKVKPMIPAAGRQTPYSKNWLFESDPDGLRAIAEVDGRQVFLYSRSQISFANKFPAVVEDLRKFENSMVLDGKITSKRGQNTYQVFDILYFDGRDLRSSPLSERRSILKAAFNKTKNVQVLETIKLPQKGEEVLAKKLTSNYRGGVTEDWLKITFDPANPLPEKKNSEKNAEIIKSSSRAVAGTSIDEPILTNLDKLFWPEEKITKGDLLDYYRSVSSYILPHLINRPESLNRQPNGIKAAGFYQKDLTGYHPRWLKTQRIFSESADKTIDYVLCQDERSLLYIVNLGCIEINPWFSRLPNLENPDFLVIDLDPDDNPFSHVVEIAHEVHHILESVGAKSFCKTSGATGIHIGVPTGAKYTFDEVREFAEMVCRVVARKYPATTSIDRNPNRRRRKIYLDFMQNRRGQTLAAPYCVRPRPGAPVSTPLKWSELTPKIRPEQFNTANTLTRLKKVGDLWQPILHDSTDLKKCVRTLQKKYKIS